jgi:hypothetical protein
VEREPFGSLNRAMAIHSVGITGTGVTAFVDHPSLNGVSVLLIDLQANRGYSSALQGFESNQDDDAELPSHWVISLHVSSAKVALSRRLRLCSATAMTDCSVIGMDKRSTVDVLYRETSIFHVLEAYSLPRSIPYEWDLVGKVFNSGNKRPTKLTQGCTIWITLRHNFRTATADNELTNHIR